MYLDLLREAMMQTAALSAAWQAVGFIHGSLGTDTLSLLGFTIGAGATGPLTADAREGGGAWTCSRGGENEEESEYGEEKVMKGEVAR